MVKLHLMENRKKKGYVTWGIPWKKGEVTENNDFILKNNDGKEIALQSKVNAYWQDGSYKWTLHTAYVEDEIYNIDVTEKIQKEVKGIEIIEDEESYIINAGRVEASFYKKGRKIINNLKIDERITVTQGELICIMEQRQQKEDILFRSEYQCFSRIDKVSVEEVGALKCVVKVEGIHINNSTGKENLPFIVRFIIHYNELSVKVIHTFLCDIDAHKDFIKGIGISFETPMRGELYNRHFKTKGDYGYFHETLQLMAYWRKAIGENNYQNQLSGKFLNFDRDKEENKEMFEVIDTTISWDSYKLYQDSTKHFMIKKSTGKEDCAYIDAIHGSKSNGLVYLGAENGGIALGMKDFWQKYPSSIWVEGFSKDVVKLTAWIWSPEAEALDMRHYDTRGYAKTCYEGFDEVRSTPYGIANTNEFIIWGFKGDIVSDEVLDECAFSLQKPAVMLADPEYYHKAGAFGKWGLIKKDTKAQKWLEKQLDTAIDFYKNEIEQRNWYGLFNYGDIMHNYDKYRHSWRYDIGGYAWQNTELVPTLWLWYAFLRSGREDIFTLAENMSRHCSDVDMYHIGQYKGLGSRHNILHWGCACKEARIGMAGHHRFAFYLTGDYRLGDVLDDTKDADFSLLNIDPLRTMYSKEEMVYPTHARTGPDWSSFCSNWLTAWERHKDSYYKEKILTGIEDIKKSPLQLISGADYEYNPETGHMKYIGENKTGSHLAICMGSVQTWIELADNLDDPQWNKMLADYGEFYHLSMKEKIEYSKGITAKKGWPFPYMAAGLGAYSAMYNKNEKLGKKIWNILFGEKDADFKIKEVENYFNNARLKEINIPTTTNFISQWCLNVIMALGMITEYMPEEFEK